MESQWCETTPLIGVLSSVRLSSATNDGFYKRFDLVRISDTKVCSCHLAHPCMLSHSALLKGRSSPRTFSWPIVDLSPEYACPG